MAVMAAEAEARVDQRAAEAVWPAPARASAGLAAASRPAAAH